MVGVYLMALGLVLALISTVLLWLAGAPRATIIEIDLKWIAASLGIAFISFVGDLICHLWDWCWIISIERSLKNAGWLPSENPDETRGSEFGILWPGTYIWDREGNSRFQYWHHKNQDVDLTTLPDGFEFIWLVN